MNLFNKIFNKKASNFVYDQGVIINISLDTLQELGSRDIRQNIDKLEAEIAPSIPAQSGIDGHEYGEGEAVIYVYGPSADRIFDSIKPILEKSGFNHIDITLQYGLPDDPGTKEKKFSL
jgi:hypothetical protein